MAYDNEKETTPNCPFMSSGSGLKLPGPKPNFSIYGSVTLGKLPNLSAPVPSSVKCR